MPVRPEDSRLRKSGVQTSRVRAARLAKQPNWPQKGIGFGGLGFNNYHNYLRLYRRYIGIMEKKMEITLLQ